MIRQYAITPDAFEAAVIKEMTPPGVVLTQVLRGLCEHGLLANLQGGDWFREISRHTRDPAMPRDAWNRVEACLKRLHDMNRLVLHPRSSHGAGDEDFRWLKSALDRQVAASEPCFDAVFASDLVLGCSDIKDEAIIPLSKALECPQWEGRQQSGTLLKTESALQKELRPFLRYARQVVLIDPYMTCRNDRFFNTVQYCADLLGKAHGTQVPGRIVIHAGDPMAFGPVEHRESVTQRLDRWQEALQPVVSHWGHAIQISLWGRKPGGPNPHDRFIITDQSAVSIAGGLDFLPDDQASRANTTNWSVVPHADAVVIQQCHYHHAKSPFQYLDTRKVGG